MRLRLRLRERDGMREGVREGLVASKGEAERVRERQKGRV